MTPHEYAIELYQRLKNPRRLFTVGEMIDEIEEIIVAAINDAKECGIIAQHGPAHSQGQSR